MPASTQRENISLSQHVSYICSRLLAYGLPLLVFLISISFYLKTYDSAQVKITFTQIGTTMLFIVWLIRMAVDGRLPFTKSDLVYIAPFLAFLGSGMIAWVHSPFREWSLEETLRRLFYMILALVILAEFRSDERTKRLWRWLMAAAWVAIGYGLIQYIDARFFPRSGSGIDPFIWRQAFGYRVFSTYGNPNFYGNFLVIMTPLLLASVLRGKGPLGRTFVLIGITIALIFLIDKMQIKFFGGMDPSYRIVFGAMILALLFLFVFLCTWKVGTTISLPMALMLFSFLFLNLYATETKGAWVGFTAALGGTIWLIFEYFLHFEERMVEPKKYMLFMLGLIALFTGLLAVLAIAFVIPNFTGEFKRIGFQILWIPALFAGFAALATIAWLVKKPWNLKKVVYGLLVFFVISMGAFVLQFASTRLTSVSFRLFTWISTWEMVQANPMLGNGVGTFKVIYPAYRRPQIIVLEAKSNTETDHAENEYIEVWQDEGIVGFGIFIWLIVTALTLGLKQLRWYSKLRVPDGDKKKKLFDIEGDPRSYEVLGFLGAYMGALIHWCMDVSIRFVSSGIFSGILPGVLVAYAKNHANPMRSEAKLGYERWIRFGLAATWTVVMIWLKMEFVPQSMIVGGDTTTSQIVTWNILAGLLLFVLLELLEVGNKPEENADFKAQYPAPVPTLFYPRLILIPAILTLGAFGIQMFGNHFRADVHHNLAIFFSKEGIWTKSPQFDSRLINMPPDIREKYQETGGALEHYNAVTTYNHAFPMAHYFTGNVYNDRGSQLNIDSLNARNRGEVELAIRLREKALEDWADSEKAYNETKGLAPNYVQVHHQMGLLETKRAEQADQWGEREKAKQYYQKAYENFSRYRMLDPVFPPNYDRLVQLLLMNNDFEKAIALYKEAIFYNDKVATTIHGEPFRDRLVGFYLSIGKLLFNQVNSAPPSGSAAILNEALQNFQLATEADPKSAEAWKGLGVVLERLGRRQDAQNAWRKVLEISPNDPDVKVNVGPR